MSEHDPNREKRQSLIMTVSGIVAAGVLVYLLLS
jgi:hypothetical protein